MTLLEESILSTVVYYDIFNLPLTSWEIFEYLIAPRRLRGKSEELNFNFYDTIKAAESENIKKFIEEKNGFHFLKSREWICESRIERQKIADKKWDKALKIIKWFQLAPFLKSVCANGSLARGFMDKDSDLDVFVIVERGRIWTARFILSLLTAIMRVKRFRQDSDVRDKICFNHFIADESLIMSFRDICASCTYSRLDFIYGDRNVLKKFYASNAWINDYLLNFQGQDKINQRIVNSSSLAAIGAVAGGLLKGKIGDIFENLFKKIQLRRIKNNLPAAINGRIIVNDGQLEFHDNYPDKSIIEKYNRKLTDFGFGDLVVENNIGNGIFLE